MAKIKVTSVNLDGCQGHVVITGTVNGNPRTLRIARSDWALDPDDMETAAINRFRSAVKEAGATTLAQVRNALIGPEFDI